MIAGSDAERGEDRAGAGSWHPHVGELEAELQDLALDPTVAPARILRGQAEDQVAEVRVARGARPGWTP